mgnify:FL=1
MKNNNINKGGILAFTLLIGLCGVSFVLGFYGWAMNRDYYNNRRIAKIKAFYNAETGMARKAYEYLWKVDFIEGYDGLEGEEIDNNMGYYLEPEFSFDQTGNRIAEVYGIHEVRTHRGTMYPCSVLVSMPARPQTLGIYMYLTDSEEAGGAPFVFDGPGDRREVNFGNNDILDGIVQSNGQLVISDYGCPDFSDAKVHLTNSTPIDLGGCSSYQDMFGGWGSDVDTVSKPPVRLPPAGYETLKTAATHIIEADRKIINTLPFKDTLIMTDIEFHSNGEYTVSQWWYLMPPHLKPCISSEQAAYPFSNQLYLRDQGEYFGQCDHEDHAADLRTCPQYLDFLASYHAKYPDSFSLWNDQFLNSTISGPAGLHHFDMDRTYIDGDGLCDSNIQTAFTPVTFQGGDNTVIYVKGGPVRVHGTYTGRYTVVTDEYTVYRRHAWPGGTPNHPVDTIWNNIWITGDLINNDAIGEASGAPVYVQNGNMSEFQPDDACDGGSDNIMGLVSGANIYIANTQDNGRGNQGNLGDVVINAGLIALNESFVIQYWQNTTNSITSTVYPLGTQTSRDAPWGDGRGDNFGNTGDNDLRGYVYLWGGVVQKHRGYMKRNPSSPYGNASIGMDKSYHYDANLDCNPPPFYPAIEFDDGSGELDIQIVGYNSTF